MEHNELMRSNVKTLSEAKTPSPESIRIVTGISAHIRPDDEKMAEWNEYYLEASRERFAFDLDYAKQFFGPQVPVLDVACIPLVLLKALIAAGFDAQGVDIDPTRYRTAVAKLGVQVARCNIERDALPFDDETFGGVVFNEIFEHLRFDPIFTVGEVNRVMKKNGVLLVSSPNPHSLEGHIRYLFNRETMFYAGSVFTEYARIWKFGHMGHVREYGTSDVAEFFQTMGFSLQNIFFRGSYRRWLLPPSARPFVTYVFKKTGEPEDPTTWEGEKGFTDRPWKRRLKIGIAVPFVWASFLLQSMFKR